MTGRCLATLLLVSLLLAGCSDTSEKRAELQRTEAELRAMTMETEQMRARLPAIVKLEEENKSLQYEVYRLAAEVDGLRRKIAERDAAGKLAKPKGHASARMKAAPE